MILVSIVMTVFNGESFVAEAIDSCLNQTHTNYELIIIDDGSSDRTQKIIRSFKDYRIKIFVNDVNRGQSFSRNLGIINSGGEYIAIMDSDDVAYPERLETQLKYLESHPEISLCCSYADIIDDKNFITGQRKLSKDESFLKLKLLFECPIIHPTVMWRKSDFIANNLWYDEFFIYAQDYELWSRALNHLKLGVIEKSLIKFRFNHTNSISNSKRKLQDKYANIIRQRNLDKIIKVPICCINNNKIYCKVLIYRSIIKSKYLTDDKEFKILFFRSRLFDGSKLPHRLKIFLRNLLIN
jgi:glycosyltransferase involved in cell wall biosynthesis